MSDPLPSHAQQLLAQRERLAKAANEAAAHHLPDAADLSEIQRMVEDELERALPRQVWRELFPTWILQDIETGAQPAHVPDAPHLRCTLCQGGLPAAPPLARLA